MRKRLEDLKKDPERYKAYLYHRALLARIRIAKMTPEQREAMRAKKRKSYEKMMNDPERHENKVQKQRERRQRDKDYCRVYEREYYKRNADKIKEKARRSYNRRLQDPETREKMKAAQARYYETRKAKLEADPIAREHAKYLRRMYQRQHYQRMKLEQPEKYEALRQKNKEKYQRRKAANDTKESKGA